MTHTRIKSYLFHLFKGAFDRIISWKDLTLTHDPTSHSYDKTWKSVKLLFSWVEINAKAKREACDRLRAQVRLENNTSNNSSEETHLSEHDFIQWKGDSDIDEGGAPATEKLPDFKLPRGGAFMIIGRLHQRMAHILMNMGHDWVPHGCKDTRKGDSLQLRPN